MKLSFTLSLSVSFSFSLSLTLSLFSLDFQAQYDTRIGVQEIWETAEIYPLVIIVMDFRITHAAQTRGV
jgi:hypothetical protein